MDFMETINEWAKKLTDKTNEVVEIAKLRTAIFAKNEKADELKKEIGEICFSMYRSGDELDPGIEKLCADIGNLSLNQILSYDFLLTGFLPVAGAGIVMIDLSHFTSATVPNHRITAVPTEQLSGQQIVILGLSFSGMRSVRCKHILYSVEYVVIDNPRHAVGCLDSIVGIVTDIPSISQEPV